MAASCTSQPQDEACMAEAVKLLRALPEYYVRLIILVICLINKNWVAAFVCVSQIAVKNVLWLLGISYCSTTARIVLSSMKMEGSVLGWVRLMVSVSSIGVSSSELSALLLLCLISRNGVLPGFRIRLVHSVLYTNYSDGNSNSNVFFISGKSKWLHLVLDQSS